MAEVVGLSPTPVVPRADITAIKAVLYGRPIGLGYAVVSFESPSRASLGRKAATTVPPQRLSVPPTARLQHSRLNRSQTADSLLRSCYTEVMRMATASA